MCICGSEEYSGLVYEYCVMVFSELDPSTTLLCSSMYYIDRTRRHSSIKLE
jgi:hypothetical protein